MQVSPAGFSGQRSSARAGGFHSGSAKSLGRGSQQGGITWNSGVCRRAVNRNLFWFHDWMVGEGAVGAGWRGNDEAGRNKFLSVQRRLRITISSEVIPENSQPSLTNPFIAMFMQKARSSQFPGLLNLRNSVPMNSTLPPGRIIWVFTDPLQRLVIYTAHEIDNERGTRKASEGEQRLFE